MRFLHQAIRDLAWLLWGPPLMSAVPGLDQPSPEQLADLRARSAPLLSAWDDQPLPLQNELYEGWMGYEDTPRLGEYVERLLAFWLARVPGVRLLGGRVPVREGTLTRGDLDLAFVDHAVAWHWEVSAKFYLGVDGDRDPARWIGPNPRDDLAAKLARIVGHQLPLGRSPAAAAALGIAAPLRSAALLRGWLFHPVDRRDGAGPTGAAHDHGRGWWLRFGEGDIPVTQRHARFVLPPRLEWLAPVHRPSDGDVHPLAPRQLANHLDRHFRRSPSAVLVCEVARDDAGWWREVDRGFVVHARWPEIIERD